MNTSISQVKDIITDYLGKAQTVAAKIKQGKAIYNEEAMQRETDRLNKELEAARRDAEQRIDAIYQQGAKAAREWATLDGSKLTPDAQLLQSQGITPEQFSEMVSKYQDNYTMLDQLRKYGERMNADEIRRAREAGNRDALVMGSYNVNQIPGPDARKAEWDQLKQRAEYFLNVADGRGMDAFTLELARSTADKSFESWGTDSPDAGKHPDAVSDFVNAWGFEKG